MKFSKILTCIGAVGAAFSAPVCPGDQGSCGESCYDPALYTCDNGQLCPLGMLNCNGACYSPSEYHCEAGTLVYGASTTIPAPAENPQPVAVPEPVQEPAQISAPSAPVQEPAPVPFSVPFSAPVQAPAPVPFSVPFSAPVQEPAPVPFSVPFSAPVQEPAPAPVPVAEPATVITPAPISNGDDILQFDGYQLVFSDEFEGDTLDRSKWSAEVNCWGGGNNEKQCYVDHPETIFVKDGQLHLKAIYKGEYQLNGTDQCTLDNEGSCSWAQPFISGRVNTKLANLAWKYGKVRVKALLPSGPFLWPAIWMLPQDDVYGTWAASGEIDIMEARGQDPSIISHAIHYGGQWPDNTYSDQLVTVENAQNDWHVYGIDWTEDTLTFNIDEVPTFTVDLNRSFYSGTGENPYTDIRQPFDQKFHLLFNVAVGGGFFDAAKYGEFDPATSAQQWTRPELAIDYVRVYQQI